MGEGPFPIGRLGCRILGADGDLVLSDQGVPLGLEFRNIRDWVFKLDDLPAGALDNEEQKKQWDDFKDQFEKFKTLRDEYSEVSKKLEELERKKRQFDEDSKVKIRKAENTMKDIFQSPYLLPGMWAALVPSITPYGGGIVPPPFIAGPPSTVPGMIYLALLFIDEIEEKIHDDMQKTGDPNCEDQL